MNRTVTASSHPHLQRLRRRRGQRGMAVFLVVLVMTMVTAIGVFSMRSASLVDRATGYHRQSVQSTAAVEFGVRSAASWLSPHKQQIRNARTGPNAPLQVPNCAPALIAANPDAECWVIKSESLFTQFESTAPVWPIDGLMGQLSSPFESSVIRAEITTEVTENFVAPAAARAGSSGKLEEVTLTTQSRIYPTDASTLTSCQAASRGAISQQKVRSHALVQF